MNASEYVDAMNALRETGGPVSAEGARSSPLVCETCGRTLYWCQGHGSHVRYRMVPNPDYRPR